MYLKRIDLTRANYFSPAYVATKIEDSSGFALSTGLIAGEVLSSGDRVYVEWEGIYGESKSNLKRFKGTGNSQELIEVLKNIHNSVTSKLASYDLSSYDDVEDLLYCIIWLGFSPNYKLV